MDFLEDALASGRRVHTPTIADACTREMLAIEADTSLPALRVVRVLEKPRRKRGLSVRMAIVRQKRKNQFTVSVSGADFETPPEVAVTVKVYDPGKVPFVGTVDLIVTGPVQPTEEIVSAINTSRKRPVSLRRWREMPSMIMPNGISASAKPFASKPLPRRATVWTIAPLAVVVVTVNVNVPGAAGVAMTVPGPVQDAACGAPAQLNDNVSESLVVAPPVATTSMSRWPWRRT